MLTAQSNNCCYFYLIHVFQEQWHICFLASSLPLHCNCRIMWSHPELQWTWGQPISDLFVPVWVLKSVSVVSRILILLTTCYFVRSKLVTSKPELRFLLPKCQKSCRALFSTWLWTCCQLASHGLQLSNSWSRPPWNGAVVQSVTCLRLMLFALRFSSRQGGSSSRERLHTLSSQLEQESRLIALATHIIRQLLLSGSMTVDDISESPLLTHLSVCHGVPCSCCDVGHCEQKSLDMSGNVSCMCTGQRTVHQFLFTACSSSLFIADAWHIEWIASRFTVGKERGLILPSNPQ